MEKQVSKAEIIFLAFNTTSYVLAEAVTSNIGFNFESRVRGLAFSLALLIEFCLFDFLFDYLMKINFHIVMIIFGIFMGAYITLDILYQTKIQTISKSYGTYYPFFIIVLFGLLCVGSVVYLIVIA